MSYHNVVRNITINGFTYVLVGCMRVSSENDRQVFDLQYYAIINAGVEERHIYQDKISGAKD